MYTLQPTASPPPDMMFSPLAGVNGAKYKFTCGLQLSVLLDRRCNYARSNARLGLGSCNRLNRP